MFTDARELEAYTYEGRPLRVPEPGSWVAFKCTGCGTRTKQRLDGGPLECDGCEAYAPVPADW
jgi:hypothetical protein